MGRPRKPAALMAAEGNPSKLSRAALAERAAREVKVDLLDIEPPDYLPGSMGGEFADLAAKLLHVGIATELDSDAIARYLMVRLHWVETEKALRRAMKGGDVDEVAKASRVHDAAFRQCRLCASDLGLTITSRCRIVVPEVEERPRNRFADFAAG